MSSIVMSAQQNNTRTAYFLDNYTYGYRFNPAFHSDRNFVSIPVLGNISLGGWIHVMEEQELKRRYLSMTDFRSVFSVPTASMEHTHLQKDVFRLWYEHHFW